MNRERGGVLWLFRQGSPFSTLAVLCLLSAAALSADANEQLELSWNNPTVNAEGEPLGPDELLETRIYCDDANESEIERLSRPRIAQFVVPPTEESFSGQYPHEGLKDCTATAVNRYKQESAPSNRATVGICRDITTVRANLQDSEGDTTSTETVTLYTYETACHADINKDGRVNFLELASITAQFFRDCAVEECTADLNRDGDVDFADAAIIRGHFFQSCCLYQ